MSNAPTHPVKEMKITASMVQAGVEAFRRWESREMYDDVCISDGQAELLAKNIFREMAKAQTNTLLLEGTLPK